MALPIINEIKRHLPQFEMPKGFFNIKEQTADNFYLASCIENRFLFVAPSLQQVTGYHLDNILDKGISWWFSIVHPEDIDLMLNRILEHCFLLPLNKRLNKPFTLVYRIKSSDGNWRWMKETKCIISITQEGKNDLVLGRTEDISDIKTAASSRIDLVMKEDGQKNPLLKAALPILRSGEKNIFGRLTVGSNYSPSADIVMPTKREKEILCLIGEGYSTKQIADKLKISINTVETHRRHLLEKIKVKNSMELIKQTSNASWLQAI